MRIKKLLLVAVLLGTTFWGPSVFADGDDDNISVKTNKFFDPVAPEKPRPEDHLRDPLSKQEHENLKRKITQEAHDHISIDHPSKASALKKAKEELDTIPTGALKIFSDFGGQIKFKDVGWDTIGTVPGSVNIEKDIHGNDLSTDRSKITAALKMENYQPTLYIDINKRYDMNPNDHLDLQYRLAKVITEGIAIPDKAILTQFFNTIRPTASLIERNERLEKFLFHDKNDFLNKNGVFTQDFIEANMAEAKDIFSRAMANYTSPLYEGTLRLYSDPRNSTYSFMNQLLDKEIFKNQFEKKIEKPYSPNLYTHLVNHPYAVGETIEQKLGVSGTHNQVNFMESIRNNLKDTDSVNYRNKDAAGQYIVTNTQIETDLKIVDQVASYPNGIKEIKYQLPAYNSAQRIQFNPDGSIQLKSKKYTKTLYDPNIIKDETMVKYAEWALKNPRMIEIGTNKYISKIGSGTDAIYFEAWHRENEISGIDEVVSIYPTKEPTIPSNKIPDW